MPHTEIPVFGNFVGYETLEADGTAKSCTASKYRNVDRIDARAAVLSIDGAAATDGIRWTVDGTAPTTDGAEGHLVPSGQSFIVRGMSNIAKLKFIRNGSNSVKVHITYFN